MASSEFQTTAGHTINLVSVQWFIKAEFITGKSADFNHVKSVDGFTTRQANRYLPAEPFDCSIPIKVYGAQKRPRSIPKSMHFEI